MVFKMRTRYLGCSRSVWIISQILVDVDLRKRTINRATRKCFNSGLIKVNSLYMMSLNNSWITKLSFNCRACYENLCELSSNNNFKQQNDIIYVSFTLVSTLLMLDKCSWQAKENSLATYITYLNQR